MTDEEILTLAEPEDETRPFTHFVNHEGRIPLYRHPPRQPVRLSDEEILALAEKYGTAEARLRPTYYSDGSLAQEVHRQVDWHIGQENLLGFARDLLEKSQ